MPEFLAETYAPHGASAARRAGEAAPVGEPSQHPAPVRLLRAIAVPEDETCSYLYQAPSVGAVRAAATRAGLRPERITQAVTTTPPQTRPGYAPRADSATGPPTLSARPHRDIPAAGAQPGRNRNPLAGPAAENGVMTGLARPCNPSPSLPPGS